MKYKCVQSEGTGYIMLISPTSQQNDTFHLKYHLEGFYAKTKLGKIER